MINTGSATRNDQLQDEILRMQIHRRSSRHSESGKDGRTKTSSLFLTSHSIAVYRNAKRCTLQLCIRFIANFNSQFTGEVCLFCNDY